MPLPDFLVQPFIGAGVGAAYADVSLKDASATYLHATRWNLAYDFMAGAALPLSQTSRFTAIYRWLHVDDVDLKCGTSGAPTLACKSDLTYQGLDVGLEMDM